jgi:hypothetical protein
MKEGETRSPCNFLCKFDSCCEQLLGAPLHHPAGQPPGHGFPGVHEIRARQNHLHRSGFAHRPVQEKKPSVSDVCQCTVVLHPETGRLTRPSMLPRSRRSTEQSLLHGFADNTVNQGFGLSPIPGQKGKCFREPL